LNKKMNWFNNKKVLGVHVDPPYIDSGRSAYAKAYEFIQHDC